MTKTAVVLNAMARPMFEPQCPDWVEPLYFTSTEHLLELAPQAEIGWFDLYNRDDMAAAIERATQLKWLNSIYAGVDGMPLDSMAARGIIFTNGAGLLSDPIAEYAVMGMLSVAKGYHKVVQAQARHEWLRDPPGRMELEGSKALILGYGGIGQAMEARLMPFGVDMTRVRRNPRPGDLGPDAWRGELGQFDWIIVTLPSTPETRHTLGAAEFAAMKPGVAIINVARGTVIDQEALIAALQSGQVGHAFLDVTDPEPLPPESPLWAIDSVQISMHLSGPSQSSMFRRASERFIANLVRWHRNEPVSPQVNLKLGY